MTCGNPGKEIIGTDGNDDNSNMAPTNLDDKIYGLDGDDDLWGSEGCDLIVGGKGNDILDGGEGLFSDTLLGRQDNDILIGGMGGDILNGGRGMDTARYYDSAARVRIDLTFGTASGGDAEGDVLKSIESLWGSSAFGDILIGDKKDNTFFGFGGQDTLKGYSGDDTLYGGNGKDKLLGGGDSDHLFGGKHRDIIDGGFGRDELFGEEGNDVLRGGPDSDELFGNNGNDELNGGSGRDKLKGGNGRDDLYGGNGTDNLFGGADADDFYFDTWSKGLKRNQFDRIHDFKPGEDKIWLDGDWISSFKDLKKNYAEQSLEGLRIGDEDEGFGNLLVLKGILLSELSAGDFVFL